MSDPSEEAGGGLDAEQLSREELVKELDLAAPGADQPGLEQRAEEMAETLTAAVDSGTREGSRAAIEEYAMPLQREAALNSEKLQQPLKKISAHTQEGGDVAESLVQLRMQVEALDPARFDFEPGWFSRMLGRLPGVGTPAKRYFSRYHTAQTVLNTIIQSLEGGREQLRRDNVTLSGDQGRLRESAARLARAIRFAQLMDERLQARLEQSGGDAERQRFISEDLLFPLRQRTVDLQQQLAVSQQGILAIEVLVRNNKELIRGVNRALDVTVNALQVAVTVALALTDQRIVLEKVQALSRTTSDLLAATAARLKTEGAAIQQQASATQLDIGALKAAFADIRAALEDIAEYRQKALPQMAGSIREMDALVADAADAIRRQERADKAEPILQIKIE